VVLAQASMARVVPRLPEDRREKIVTSPTYAVEDVLSELRLNATARAADGSAVALLKREGTA
jgi:hypothetical protein